MKLILFATIFLFLGCTKTDVPFSDHPGAQIFLGITRADVQCYRCHGDLGQGTSRAPALVTNGKTIERSSFVKTVLQGRNLMPIFASVLSDKEVESIADWLEKLHEAKPSGSG